MQNFNNWSSLASCYFLLVPRTFRNGQKFYELKMFVTPNYQEFCICILVTHISAGNNMVFVVWNIAIMQFVQSGTAKPVQHSTAIAHSFWSDRLSDRTPDMACSTNITLSVTNWAQDDTQLNVLLDCWLKMLCAWNGNGSFFCRKWNLHYKCFLCITSLYNKPALDIFTYSMQHSPSW